MKKQRLWESNLTLRVDNQKSEHLNLWQTCKEKFITVGRCFPILTYYLRVLIVPEIFFYWIMKVYQGLGQAKLGSGGMISGLSTLQPSWKTVAPIHV